MIKDNKGITLATLVITISIMMMLAVIVVNVGSKSIDEAKLQNIKTNMLLIEAKVKEYVENANYELGVKPEEATEEMKAKATSMIEGEGKGTKITSSDSIYTTLTSIGVEQKAIDDGTIYKLSTDDLSKLGIKDVKSDDKEGWYVVAYDITNNSAKIYNTKGVKAGKNTLKYGLDDIRDL